MLHVPSGPEVMFRFRIQKHVQFSMGKIRVIRIIRYSLINITKVFVNFAEQMDHGEICLIRTGKQVVFVILKVQFLPPKNIQKVNIHCTLVGLICPLHCFVFLCVVNNVLISIIHTAHLTFITILCSLFLHISYSLRNNY